MWFYDTSSTTAFMSKSVFFNKYDIFLSYSQDIQSKMLSLYETLTSLYGLNVWVDLQQHTSKALRDQESNSSRQISDGLNQSKVFVPCLNEAYSKTEAFEKEIQLAISQKKHILVLLLENKPLSDYGRIGQLLSNFTKIEFYRDPEALDKWSGLLFNKFIDMIELMICRKINRIQSIAVNGTQLSSACKLFPKTSPKMRRVSSKETTRYYGFNQVKTSKPLNLPAKHLTRLAFLSAKRRLIFCDIEVGCLILTDVLGSYLTKVILDEVKKPYAVAIGKRNEVFIGDIETERIVVYDLHLKHVRNLDLFKLTQKRFEMKIDEENENVYISDYEANKLIVLSGYDGTVLSKIDIKKPSYLVIKSDRIYVTSDDQMILVLRKDTCDEIQQIKIDNWCNLRGLHVDNKMNVMTSAFEKNFPIAFFYLVNPDGALLNKVYIHMKDIQDFVVVEKKFYFNTEISSPCILEFQ